VAKTSVSPSSRSTDKPAAVASGKRIQVRRSGVHGKGVFALQDLAEGETLIEYVGEIISWDEAQDRHPHDPKDPNHTFYFHVNEDKVIDALHGGNSSRWINHSCDPNCEADEENERVFIKALRNIKAGEELNYDYGLIIDEPYTKKLLAEYPCWCGAKNCRGTLLSPKDREDTPKIPGQKKAKNKSKDKAKSQAKPKSKVKAESKVGAKAKTDAKTKKKPAEKSKKLSKKG
jgi:SET domain-containing protein